MSWPIIFTVGGTVQAGGGLYISRKADRELLNLCRAGAFAYVLTSRQMGKSSLMVRTAESLAEEDARSVIIDLTQLGVQVTAQEWHLGLLTAVEDSLELDTDVVDWWQQNTHLSVTKRLTLFFEEVLLAEVAGRVVIFIDEIDSTLSLPFTDDFYAAIRYFYNARAFKPEFHRLSFVLIGVATPGDLIADPKRTPFNIGQRVDLTDFTIEEALPLTEGLNLPPDEARRVLSWVLKWTGGHPYLTQRTCRIVAQQGRADWTEADIDRLVAGTFLGEQSEQDNNLQFVRDMLTKRAPDFKSTLATYRDIRLKRRPVEDEEQSLVKSHLKLSGVVRRKGNNLVVRNRIYAEVFNRQWINQHWPVDRRQRLQVVLGTVAGSLVTLLLAVLAVSWVADRFSTAQATAQAEAQAAQATATHIQATAEAQAILDATAQANIAATATLESARADDATSRQLAAQAINALDETRPDLALLLSVEALRAADTWEARSSLLAAFQTFPHLYAVLQPTPQDLWRMAFSPNGQLLAAAAEDGTIYLWDVDTRRPFSDPLNGNTEKVWSLAFDPAGQRLAAGSTDGVLIVWDVDTRRPVYRFDNTPGESIAGVAFSPNGQTLVAGSWDASIRFWDLSGGQYSRPVRVEQAGSVYDVAFSPDGQTLAAAIEDGSIILLNPATRQIERRILVARNHRIWRLAFSPNGETIAAASDDMLVRLFDAGTGRQIGQPLAGHEDEVIDVAFSPDGQTLASTGWDAVTFVWDAATGRPARDPFFGQGVAFSPDGQILASAGCRQWSGETCVQGAALLWDTSAQLPIHRVINSHRAAVLSLAFSPNGPHLAAGDAAGTIALWEAETGEPVIGPVATGAAEIFGLAFSPNGQTLASANGDTTVRLWDGATLEPRASPFKGHPYWPLAVAFSPNGKTIASAGCHTVDANGLCTEGEIRLWEAATGRPLGDPAVGHAGWVTGLAFSPDRDVLLSGGDDGTLYLWNPGSMQPDGPILAAHPTAVTGLAFSPNGATFASGSCGKFSDDSTHCVQGQILMWDVESRQPKFELPPEQRGAITGLAFSPDGKLLASGSCAEYATGTGDCVAGTARLWDAETGQPIGGPLAGPAAQVTSVAFSPGSALLAAASDDGAIIVWDVTPETWQTWACRIANRNLSQTEWNQFISPDVPYRLTCPALPPGEGVTTQS